MRKWIAAAAAMALLPASAALAASHKTGTYTAGSSTGDGVSIKIGKSSFAVNRISYMETCTGSAGTFNERFAFVKGSAAQLTGKINRRGNFRGTFRSSDGSVTVSGHVAGGKATISSDEQGTFTNEQGTFSCAGSHTFHARR